MTFENNAKNYSIRLNYIIFYIITILKHGNCRHQIIKHLFLVKNVTCASRISNFIMQLNYCDLFGNVCLPGRIQIASFARKAHFHCKWDSLAFTTRANKSGLMAPVYCSIRMSWHAAVRHWMWAKARLPMHIRRTDGPTEWVSEIVGRRECWWIKKVVIIQLRVPCDIIINVHTCTMPLHSSRRRHRRAFARFMHRERLWLLIRSPRKCELN